MRSKALALCRLIAAVSAILLVTPLAKAQTLDFAKDVYPILQRSCFECHGAEKQEAGLRLDRRDDALESGSIEAGDPNQSELLRRVLLPAGHDELMPAVGDPLPMDQVDVLRRWIAAGATWPEEFKAGRHWAYIAPERPVIADAQEGDTWVRSPIDHFVLRQLRQHHLEPAPPAAPEKLIRRVYLDLIGLPPSPDEVEAFVSDPSPMRFEAIVDDLLGRPQFGERWARPWLDLARYADSHGFQRDNFRDVWAYRDWVIAALNEDMPFDQFSTEQIAGDLLPGATESQRIATGFHRCTPTNVEAGSLPEETRIEQVIDRVNTTGAVWLGTTLECCQCHDHKYDPFSTKEYYELLAYFNNTEKEADRANPKTPSSIKFQGPSMPLADQQRDSRRSELQEQLADARRRQAKLRQQVEAGLENRIGRLNEQIADAPRTRVLEIHDFQSQGTTDTHEILDDGSVLLVGGDPPDKDEYKMRATIDTDQQGNEQVIKVSALRLDALLDDSLPEQGPGRGERRNFVLNHFGVEFLAADQSRRKLSFAAARASFSQKKWDVFGAVDDQPKTGWAISPQQGKPHWATFELDQPITLGPGDCLEVTMTHSFGRAISIGRFKISAVSGDVHAEPVPEMIVKAAQKPSAQWTNKERDALVDYFIETDSQTIAIKETIRDLEKQIAGVAPDTTLVMVELDQPRPSNVLMSGDYKSPGQPVQPGTPKALHPTPTGPPNRLTLAKWLTSRDNPIVARVTVNRWWAELFGQGIVTTVDDFGIKGEPPSHPELLDWLAMELMDNGWSMKQLLKTIVMSSTYQQSSAIRHDLRDVDPDNRLLARGARFRMDAEMIRDNALAASGLLSLKQFGPPIRPFQPDGVWSKVGGEAYDYEVSPDGQRHRRGIYVVIKRGSPYPSFVNFDATARLACTVKRSRTNTPLQALTLLNDPVFVEAASSLSERIRNERGGEPVDEQIDYGFQICTSRKPNESERATLMHLYRQQSDSPDPMYGVATVLLNLHETITKD